MQMQRQQRRHVGAKPHERGLPQRQLADRQHRVDRQRQQAVDADREDQALVGEEEIVEGGGHAGLRSGALDRRTAEQADRTEPECGDQQDEADRILQVRRDETGSQHFEHADENASDQRALDVAEPADNDDGETLQHHSLAHVGLDRVEVQPDQHTGRAAERAGDERDQPHHRIGVDAHQLRRFAVFSQRTHRQAEAGETNEREQRRHDQHRGGHDKDLRHVHPHVTEQDRGMADDGGRQSANLGAEQCGHQRIEQKRRTERDHQRRQFRRLFAPQRRQQRRVEDNGDQAGQHRGARQRHPDREAEALGGVQREKRAGGEIEAVSEVDDAEHAEHQREAERKQGVGRAQNQPVQELLRKLLENLREHGETGSGPAAGAMPAAGEAAT